MNAGERLSCEETFRRLDLYLDRTLDDAERRQVERHLRTCAECAAEYRFESAVVEEIRGKLRRIKTSPELLEAISARLAEAAREGETG